MFGAPLFEPEIFWKQIYCIEECTCDIVGTFQRHPQSFGALVVIRRPGNCALLAPPRYALCTTLTYCHSRTRRGIVHLFQNI